MTLKDCRDRIDEINNQMLELLKERMAVSAEIARLKKEAGLPVLNAEREKAILDDIECKAGDEMAPYAVALFKELFAISKEYQRKIIGG